MNKRYWLSTTAWTGAVDVVDEIVVKTPPILRGFKGKNLKYLIAWASIADGFQLAEIGPEGIRYIN